MHLPYFLIFQILNTYFLALDRSDSGCASEDEEVSQDSPPLLPVKPKASSAPEDIVICWRQSGKLWDARMQGDGSFLSGRLLLFCYSLVKTLAIKYVFSGDR